MQKTCKYHKMDNNNNNKKELKSIKHNMTR